MKLQVWDKYQETWVCGCLKAHSSNCMLLLEPGPSLTAKATQCPSQHNTDWLWFDADQHDCHKMKTTTCKLTTETEISHLSCQKLLALYSWKNVLSISVRDVAFHMNFHMESDKWSLGVMDIFTIVHGNSSCCATNSATDDHSVLPNAVVSCAYQRREIQLTRYMFAKLG